MEGFCLSKLKKLILLKRGVVKRALTASKSLEPRRAQHRYYFETLRIWYFLNTLLSSSMSRCLEKHTLCHSRGCHTKQKFLQLILLLKSYDDSYCKNTWISKDQDHKLSKTSFWLNISSIYLLLTTTSCILVLQYHDLNDVFRGGQKSWYYSQCCWLAFVIGKCGKARQTLELTTGKNHLEERSREIIQKADASFRIRRDLSQPFIWLHSQHVFEWLVEMPSAQRTWRRIPCWLRHDTLIVNRTVLETVEMLFFL